jgi:membrane protein DedA with SNARE-associated domain
MLDSLTGLTSASPWTYAVVPAVAALDAIVSIVPGETVLVAAAALASTGGFALSGVVVAAATGALIGYVGR